MRRLAGLAIVLVGILLTFAQPTEVLAHATLRSSDPAINAFLRKPPARVTLGFSEPLEARSSTILILDATGRKLSTAPTSVSDETMSVELPALQPGIYNVVWENLSRIDGHPIRGSFPFTVLNPDGSVPDQTNTIAGGATSDDPAPLADGVAIRALSLVGLSLVVAGALVVLLWPNLEPGMRRGLARGVYAGAGVLAAATVLNFITIRDAYDGVGFRELVLETPAGGYWSTRLGLGLLVAVSATGASRAPRSAAVVQLACVAVWLWTFTSTSHAAASVGSAWARGIDVTHGIAALAWIGGVTGLALAARLGRRGPEWATALPRFSLLASTMVFVLVVTGFLNAVIEIRATEQLWETRYGVTLLVKLGLMVPLLAVAGYNARWGKASLMIGNTGEPRRFVRTATFEVALGVTVFLAAAALTQTTASKLVIDAPDAKPFEQESPFEDLVIGLSIDPNRTGLNTYRVELTKGGQPVEAERVRLTFRYQEDATIGASSLNLAKSGDAYLGQGPFMTLEGRWRVETEIRRPDATDVVGFFDVRPAGSAVTGVLSGDEWSNPAPGMSWNEFGGLTLIASGFGVALAKGPLKRARKEAGWAANGMTMAGFAFGVLLLFGVHRHAPQPGLPQNPIYPDSNSISVGRTAFLQNCATCHGSRGVPPKGLDLNPYPLDLTVHVPQHADGQVYNFIAGGVPGSAMRAWAEGEGALTEEQIWHIVNFLRTLTPVDQ